MDIFSKVFVFAAILLLPFTAAQAAEISCVENWTAENTAKLFTPQNAPPANSCAKIWLSGEIVAGDYDLLSQALETKFSYATEILMSSPGGEVRESIRMGQLIRSHFIRATAPSSDTCGEGVLKTEGDEGKTLCSGPDCVCASACFLLWAGSGTVRLGNVVGLHKPSYYLPTSVFNQALMLYRKQSTMPDLLKIMSDVRDYLSSMGIPQTFGDIMTRSTSSRVYWLTPLEAASMEFPSAADSSFKQACGIPATAETLHASAAADAGYISCIDRVALQLRAPRKTAMAGPHPTCFRNCSISTPVTALVKALSDRGKIRAH